MDRRNQHIFNTCEDYLYWLDSKRYFVKQLPINILAQYQPRRVGVEPDAALSSFLAAFHTSLVHEISKDLRKGNCFLYVFFPKGRPAPLKTLAFELGVDRDTVAEWAHKAAENIFKHARMLEELHQAMAREVAGYELHNAGEIPGKTVPAKAEDSDTIYAKVA